MPHISNPISIATLRGYIEAAADSMGIFMGFGLSLCLTSVQK